MQAEAKRDALLGEMGGEGDGDAAVAVADDTVDGVIVISDAGIINMTNRVLNDLFG